MVKPIVVNYIDPFTRTIRSYYPDFLVKNLDGSYDIIEVKGDHLIDDVLVQAKAQAASYLARDSGLTYRMILGSGV